MALNAQPLDEALQHFRSLTYAHPGDLDRVFRELNEWLATRPAHREAWMAWLIDLADDAS